MSNAAKGLDPQEWDTCSPLWSETHLCKLDVNGVPVSDGHGGCVAETGVPIGTDYGPGKRRMYEHFTCDQNLCSLEILLDAGVSYPDGAANKYKFWYTNPTVITGPKVHPDQGGVEIVDTAGTLAVKSHKTFGFDNYADAAIVYLVLANIESANYLADLVCCHQ